MLESGGYDLSLNCHEDVELHVRQVLRGNAPWYIHTDVPATMVGKKYQPGGIADVGDRDRLTEADIATLQRKYGPDLITEREAKGRKYCLVRWGKVYERAGTMD